MGQRVEKVRRKARGLMDELRNALKKLISSSLILVCCFLTLPVNHMETKRVVPPKDNAFFAGGSHVGGKSSSGWSVVKSQRSPGRAAFPAKPPALPRLPGGRIAELRAILTLQGWAHVPGSPGGFVPGLDPANSASKPTTPEIQLLIFKKVIASHLVD